MISLRMGGRWGPDSGRLAEQEKGLSNETQRACEQSILELNICFRLVTWVHLFPCFVETGSHLCELSKDERVGQVELNVVAFVQGRYQRLKQLSGADNDSNCALVK